MVIMSNKFAKSSLQHYGVPGMKWGVRKNYQKVKKIYRITRNPDESGIVDGYFTTSLKEAKTFTDFINSQEKIPGVKIYNMQVKLKDVIVTPSEKEEVEIQLKLLKDKKIRDIWSDEIAKKKMSTYYYDQNHSEFHEYDSYVDYYKSDEAKRDLGNRYAESYSRFQKKYTQLKKAYDEDTQRVKKMAIDSIKTDTNSESLLNFSMAVFGSPELRKIYRDKLVSEGYNAVEDHWGQREKNGTGNRLSSPSAIMILDKRIFKSVKVK